MACSLPAVHLLSRSHEFEAGKGHCRSQHTSQGVRLSDSVCRTAAGLDSECISRHLHSHGAAERAYSYQQVQAAQPGRQRLATICR